MHTIPFALSVHHFINSVGADAGFASIIGLALLVLLYFAQARETATLRDRADEAGQRVQELENELAGLADQVAALPARDLGPRRRRARDARVRRRPGPGARGVAGAAANLPPSAPAGVGAPALAAATRLIPDPVFAQPAASPVGLVSGTTDEATSVHASAGASRWQRLVAPSRRGLGGDDAAHGRGAGGWPVAAGRRSRSRRTGPSAGRTGPGNGRAGSACRTPAVGSGDAAGSPQDPLGNRASRARWVARGRCRGRGRACDHEHQRRVESEQIVGRGGGRPARRRKPPDASVTAVNPATVTVAVLNGTSTNGLAGDVSTKLHGDGYKKGYVGNFTSNQTQTSTAVLYMRGYKRDATSVATALKLRPAAVQPIDPSTQPIACPPASGPCKSSVVVTVGSDLASLATPTQ